MKKRFIADLLIYFLIPIIVCNIFNENTQYVPRLILSMIGIGYTFFIRYYQYRVNISGVIFISIYMFIQSIQSSLNSAYDIYIQNTYCIIGGAILLIIALVFNKNIIKQTYIDFLKALNYTSININHIIKKHNLKEYFDKFSNIVSIHLLSITLIRINNIINLGKDRFTEGITAEVLLNILFIILEIVCLNKFINNYKNNIKVGKSKNYNKLDLNTKSNIINFNKYKNFNR